MAVTANRSFVMQGTREVMSSGFAHMEQQVAAVEKAVQENPGLAFDLSKSLIEGACCTILAERGIPFNPRDDLPQLYRRVVQHMPLLPVGESQAADVRRSVQQTLSGLNTSIQGICELRNQCGFASHGSSSSRPTLEWIQAWMAAETADTIVSFLYRLHRQDRTPTTSAETSYDEHPDFNESIDESHGMLRILDAEFRPSEVLFQMEPETYRIHLAEFDSQIKPGGDDTAESEL